jgi:molecular chaperone Hsp33
MADALPRARVLRALTSDHQVRFSVLEADALWDGVRRGHPHLEPAACACLVELFSAALLLQSRNFFSERLQLMVKAAGRARTLVADSWPEGDIRGFLDLAEAPNAGPWFQGPGLLRVMRSTPEGQPYVGSLELVEGALEAQIEAYLLQSEQVQASVTLWCDPGTGEAGGLFVEPLPGCPEERLARLVHALEGLEVVPLPERVPEFLCSWINQGEGAELLSTTAVQYHCRCRKDALLEILQGFDPGRKEELFHGPGPAEVRCDYCGKAYLIRRSELQLPEPGIHAEA